MRPALLVFSAELSQVIEVSAAHLLRLGHCPNMA
jgi:hypothetical protein